MSPACCGLPVLAPQAGDGTMWELDAIAGVFIGGAAVAGGIGTVFGAVIGGLVMAVLNNGLQLVGVPTDRMQVIKGLVLLVAVGIDVLNKQQGRFSFIGIMMAKLKSGRTGGQLEQPQQTSISDKS